jgi:hypothetical protein
MDWLNSRKKPRFKHLSNVQLVERINNAPEFEWNFEGYELERRVKKSAGNFKCSMQNSIIVILKNNNTN